MKDNVKNYKLIFIAVAIISSVLLILEISFAWFMSNSMTDNSDTGVKIIGTIDLDVTYDFSFYNDALSPDSYILGNKSGNNISTLIKTTGDNNIDEVFVKVKFITNISQLSLHFDGNLLSNSVTSYTEECNEKWIQSDYIETTDGENTIYTYEYYYIGLVGNTNVTFNRGYYVNNHIDNSYAKDGVYIKMEVYGLQSLYGAYLEDEDWESAPGVFEEYAQSVTGY